MTSLYIPQTTVPPVSVIDTVISSSSNNTLVGEEYTLNCISTAIPGFTQSPTITWRRHDGIVNTTASIIFDRLLASDGGNYTCTSILTSPALDTPAVVEKVHSLIVQCKHVPYYGPLT